ncbi:hypothetical protein E2C01_010574 [Portunus trituberculatus]|uniref:RRM domain-containing protein n=1 Tax=Portunus trituberculatus TaxID=210409 RepID=A0A5B7D8R3_PORTR|nr:hypothetical protein [Portunus trituberculatus]
MSTNFGRPSSQYILATVQRCDRDKVQCLKRKSSDWSLEEGCPPAKKARLEFLRDEEPPHSCPGYRIGRQAGCSLKRQYPSDWKPEGALIPAAQTSIIQGSEARDKIDDAPTPAKRARIGHSPSRWFQDGKWPGVHSELANGTSNWSKTETSQDAAEHRKDSCDTLAQSENEIEEEEESLTVKVPSNNDIARLGQMARWMHLSVLVNNVKFSIPKSRVLQALRSMGPLRHEHMPRHLPHRHDSHRGFAVVTYRTAHDTDVALREGRALLEEAGCHGVLLRRLGNYPGYAKYCEGIDVAQVMKEQSIVEEAATERNLTTMTASPSRTRQHRVGEMHVARSVLRSTLCQARRVV